MDKLAEQLKRDADRIDVQVSDEMQQRIVALLHNARPRRQRPASFWWASSLTGVAAALLIIAVMNSQPPPSPSIVPSHTPEPSSRIVAATPAIDWKSESAMLTRPLRKELEDLQSDFRKAEEKVRDDIGL